MKKKLLTDKQKLNRYKFLQNLLIGMLERVQRERFHEPNSDWHEYCNGCGNSPYYRPAHKPGCLVVELAETLRIVKENMEQE